MVTEIFLPRSQGQTTLFKLKKNKSFRKSVSKADRNYHGNSNIWLTFKYWLDTTLQKADVNQTQSSLSLSARGGIMSARVDSTQTKSKALANLGHIHCSTRPKSQMYSLFIQTDLAHLKLCQPIKYANLQLRYKRTSVNPIQTWGLLLMSALV